MAGMQKVSAKRPAGPARKVSGRSANHNLLWLLVKSFGCGAGTALVLCALAAQIFAHTALSLELVKPAACGSAVVGTVISGLLLANGIARQRLLCGTVCGAFYVLCLILATVLNGNLPVFNNINLYLAVGMLLGGTAGGILSAVGTTGESHVPHGH